MFKKKDMKNKSKDAILNGINDYFEFLGVSSNEKTKSDFDNDNNTEDLGYAIVEESVLLVSDKKTN